MLAVAVSVFSEAADPVHGGCWSVRVGNASEGSDRTIVGL